MPPVPPERNRNCAATQWLRRWRAVSQRAVGARRAQVQVRRYCRAANCTSLEPDAGPGSGANRLLQRGRRPGRGFDRQARFSPYCAAYNLTGQPAVSLPWGATADGAPIGVMLAASPGADGLLVAVSAWLEEARPWADRHPQVWYGTGLPLP
jgi:amidase